MKQLVYFLLVLITSSLCAQSDELKYNKECNYYILDYLPLYRHQLGVTANYNTNLHPQNSSFTISMKADYNFGVNYKLLAHKNTLLFVHANFNTGRYETVIPLTSPYRSYFDIRHNISKSIFELGVSKEFRLFSHHRIILEPFLGLQLIHSNTPNFPYYYRTLRSDKYYSPEENSQVQNKEIFEIQMNTDFVNQARLLAQISLRFQIIPQLSTGIYYRMGAPLKQDFHMRKTEHLQVLGAGEEIITGMKDYTLQLRQPLNYLGISLYYHFQKVELGN
ncbi:hypothetical protein SAMN05216474_2426 [Lishizhenia tianjinensis]|uniref:Outer membrane protein beta-barrel domain-containing protein n=1 Tax=Lishizhenia tianjinensis TaxID=477690 RepID=A0A1I7AZV8_9FLAO|nr:hypothetical protein [Lishizhenia tianjinensis]SFT80450.1 hypothetical protein SAMN05216474_2426 [Lishizhenia tianjinensis]